MQKKILSMILAIAMVLSMFAGIAVTASAAETTLSFAGGSGTNGEWTFADEASGVSAVFAAGNHTTQPRWDATCVRFYGTADKTNTLTVSAPAGGTITGIAFAMNGTYDLSKVAADSGDIDTEAKTWTGSVDSVVFTTGAQTRFESITVTYTGSSCDHANATVTTTDATCTVPGSIVTTCSCGYTKTEEIAALGHNYVDGTCERCGEAQPDVASYKLIDIADVKAGNYIIAARRNATYPTVYPATNTLTTGSNYDWNVSDTSVTATADVITADLLPADAQIFVLEGNNTDGFTIGYEADGAMLYLGFSSITANRKLAFAAEYATTLWTVVADAEGGFALTTPIEGGTYAISQNSTAASAIRGYKSGVIYEGIYLFREDVPETVCEHLNTTEIAAVAATCTEAGNTAGVKCSDCGEIVSGYEAVPALGHAYSYVEAEGNMTKTCANCGDTATYAINTIAEAKADTEGTAVYAVKGIVTYVGDKEYYIEDATGALCVYFGFNNAAAMPAVALGDELFVADTVTTYKGLIETTNTTYAEVGVLSSGNALPSQEVTIAQLLADTTNEYLGERVIIKGATVGVVNAAGNTPLTVDESSINIYKATLAENVTENDIVDATAIVSTYDGYQLLINPGTAATDVVVITEGAASEVVINTIAEAKAGTVGEYYRVEGVVTFIDGKNVYIQDETGGLVVYLSANAANTAVGDKVRAYGALKNYNGLLELDGVAETDTAFYEILSNGNTVAAQAVTVSTLAADTTLEYHAEKVTLSGTIVSVGSWSSSYKNVDYTISDGTSTILLYRVPAATEADVLTVGTIVAIEGVVAVYKSANQIRVATMTVTGTCAHESTVLEGVVAGDCVTDGYTGDTKCTVCGAVVTAGTVITAPGHTYEDGYCSVCGEEEPAPAGPFYYAKVTSAPESWAGTYIIVYEDGAGNAYVLNYADAVNGYVAANYANYSIAGTDALAALEATIETVEGGYAIKTPEGYIYSVANSNSMKFGTDATVNTIEFNEAGNVVISCNDAPLQFNAASNQMRFRYYTKANQQLISLYARVEGEMPACPHSETVIKNAVEATCQEAGYTGDTYCALCFIELSKGTATETGDHTYVDGTCSVCGASEAPAVTPDENLKFTMNISVGAAMSVSYNVMASAVSKYADFYLEVSKASPEGEPTVITYGLTEGHEPMVNMMGIIYSATFAGISAKQMGDEFSTTLYAIDAEGNLYKGETVVESIKGYLVSKSSEENATDAFKTMSVDMLKYGAAAQTIFAYGTDNLVTADLSEELLAYATVELPEATDISAASGEGATISVNVTVGSKVELGLSIFKTGLSAPETVRCEIRDSEGNLLAEPTVANAMNMMFSAGYSEVGAREMRKPITATFYMGDEAVSQTITWSVESYVAQVRANENSTANDIAMVNAMLTYGDAVAAYLTSIGQ